MESPKTTALLHGTLSPIALSEARQHTSVEQVVIRAKEDIQSLTLRATTIIENIGIEAEKGLQAIEEGRAGVLGKSQLENKIPDEVEQEIIRIESMIESRGQNTIEGHRMRSEGVFDQACMRMIKELPVELRLQLEKEEKQETNQLTVTQKPDNGLDINITLGPSTNRNLTVNSGGGVISSFISEITRQQETTVSTFMKMKENFGAKKETVLKSYKKAIETELAERETFHLKKETERINELLTFSDPTNPPICIRSAFDAVICIAANIRKELLEYAHGIISDDNGLGDKTKSCDNGILNSMKPHPLLLLNTIKRANSLNLDISKQISDLINELNKAKLPLPIGYLTINTDNLEEFNNIDINAMSPTSRSKQSQKAKAPPQTSVKQTGKQSTRSASGQTSPTSSQKDESWTGPDATLIPFSSIQLPLTRETFPVFWYGRMLRLGSVLKSELEAAKKGIVKICTLGLSLLPFLERLERECWVAIQSVPLTKRAVEASPTKGKRQTKETEPQPSNQTEWKKDEAIAVVEEAAGSVCDAVGTRVLPDLADVLGIPLGALGRRCNVEEKDATMSQRSATPKHATAATGKEKDKEKAKDNTPVESVKQREDIGGEEMYLRRLPVSSIVQERSDKPRPGTPGKKGGKGSKPSTPTGTRGQKAKPQRPTKKGETQGETERRAAIHQVESHPICFAVSSLSNPLDDDTDDPPHTSTLLPQELLDYILVQTVRVFATSFNQVFMTFICSLRREAKRLAGLTFSTQKPMVRSSRPSSTNAPTRSASGKRKLDTQPQPSQPMAEVKTLLNIDDKGPTLRLLALAKAHMSLLLSVCSHSRSPHTAQLPAPPQGPRSGTPTQAQVRSTPRQLQALSPPQGSGGLPQFIEEQKGPEALEAEKLLAKLQASSSDQQLQPSTTSTMTTAERLKAEQTLTTTWLRLERARVRRNATNRLSYAAARARSIQGLLTGSPLQATRSAVELSFMMLEDVTGEARRVEEGGRVRVLRQLAEALTRAKEEGQAATRTGSAGKGAGGKRLSTAASVSVIDSGANKGKPKAKGDATRDVVWLRVIEMASSRTEVLLLSIFKQEGFKAITEACEDADRAKAVAEQEFRLKQQQELIQQQQQQTQQQSQDKQQPQGGKQRGKATKGGMGEGQQSTQQEQAPPPPPIAPLSLPRAHLENLARSLSLLSNILLVPRASTDDLLSAVQEGLVALGVPTLSCVEGQSKDKSSTVGGATRYVSLDDKLFPAHLEDVSSLSTQVLNDIFASFRSKATVPGGGGGKGKGREQEQVSARRQTQPQTSTTTQQQQQQQVEDQQRYTVLGARKLFTAAYQQLSMVGDAVVKGIASVLLDGAAGPQEIQPAKIMKPITDGERGSVTARQLDKALPLSAGSTSTQVSPGTTLARTYTLLGQLVRQANDHLASVVRILPDSTEELTSFGRRLSEAGEAEAKRLRDFMAAAGEMVGKGAEEFVNAVQGNIEAGLKVVGGFRGLVDGCVGRLREVLGVDEMEGGQAGGAKGRAKSLSKQQATNKAKPKGQAAKTQSANLRGQSAGKKGRGATPGKGKNTRGKGSKEEEGLEDISAVLEKLPLDAGFDIPTLTTTAEQDEGLQDHLRHLLEAEDNKGKKHLVELKDTFGEAAEKVKQQHKEVETMIQRLTNEVGPSIGMNSKGEAVGGALSAQPQKGQGPNKKVKKR